MAEPFAEDVIEELLQRLAEGEGLAAACRDPRLPSRFVVYRWMRGNDELAARIAEAREIGYWDRAEKALEAARTAKDPIAGRLALDAERWFLGKISQTFADKPFAVGIAVNVGADDAFAAVTDALNRAAGSLASGATSTRAVDIESQARPGDAAGRLEDLAGAGRERLGEDPDRS